MENLKIITFAHQKGGVGKSTLAFNLSKYLANNSKVGLIDLDEQGSCYALKDLEPSLNIELFDDLNLTYFNDKDFVIIDTPPYINNNIESVLKKTDILIIPTKPSVPDILAISHTVKYALEIKKNSNQKLKIGVVVNMEKPNAKINEAAIQQIEKLGVKVIQVIGDRTTYGASFLNGGIIESTNSKAIKEMKKLTESIIKM